MYGFVNEERHWVLHSFPKITVLVHRDRNKDSVTQVPTVLLISKSLSGSSCEKIMIRIKHIQVNNNTWEMLFIFRVLGDFVTTSRGITKNIQKMSDILMLNFPLKNIIYFNIDFTVECDLRSSKIPSTSDVESKILP